MPRIGIMPFILALTCSTGLLCGCQQAPSDDPLESVLDKAGRNRTELERVLAHYAEGDDTLKYKAAQFLILHMDAQESDSGTRLEQVLPHLRMMNGMTEPRANQFMDSVNTALSQQKVKRTTLRTPDIEVISGDFLIENIDQAFEAWRNAPWFEQVDFNTFCNYILPYKSGRGQMQAWRQTYRDSLERFVITGIQPGNMLAVKDSLLAKTRPKFRFISNLGMGEDMGAVDLLKTKAGQCYQWAHTSNHMMRSFGIPSVLIYAPQWATFPAGHAWNGIVDSNGQILPYAIESNIPYQFTPMFWPYKSAKLYMQPYAKNDLSFAMQVLGRDDVDIPKYLADPRIVDVTAQMIPVVDVPLTIKYQPPRKQDFVFLCVFGRSELNAIDWSKIDGGRAVFNDVGKDVVYVPAFYLDEEYYPASDPIVISYEGEIIPHTADTTEMNSVRLYRKFPMKGSMFRYTEPFMGMQIQTSTDKNFTNPVVAHQIDRYPSPIITDGPKQRDRWKWVEYRDSVVFDKPVKAQYLRFFAASKRECIVGEIECFDENGQIIKGKPYGSKPGAEYIQDGMYGECFHDKDTLGWIAIDFGKQVTVSKIRYLPSHDSNSIQVGENYELSYWSNGWTSLGTQTAKQKYLEYRVPANALFWLHNLDTGKEERVFTIDENGEQVWW